MFRQLLLALPILSLISVSAKSAQNPSELLSQCEQFVRSTRVKGHNIEIHNDPASLECWAYFNAVQDLIIVTFNQRPPFTPALHVCAPANSTTYELIGVFVSYAQKTPTVLSRKIGSAVMSALMSAYPCNSG